ncbi:guanylate-binding protein 1-like [Pelobates fuscus]|uniref:guanylate-binding protein 1-like n=1 Tax=Pelobates fuscus TaxID=191477 RepID=UPI002FE48FA1
MAANILLKAPVCLIKNTPDGKLEVNPDALEILSKITQPVVVVAIVGLYRTGKSYLMNKLAGLQKGFDLGYTVQSQTKGIWMWCKPHPTKKDHVLVLLDTEGLGDVEKGDTKNDIWIFSLALLLSSALVYNSMGTINQDAIDKLHFVKQIADLIKVKSKDNDDEEADFSRHFPIFIWAVRDFNLKLEIDGKLVTEDEYLDNALKLQQPEKTVKIQELNMSRNRLRMYFRTRKCFVFERPSDDISALQSMEEVQDQALKSSFVTKSKEFCQYVFNNADIKYLDGTREVDGKCLGLMAKSYTETICSSNIACMENVVMSVSEIENKVAVQEASKYYEDKMKERATFPTDTMETFMDLSGQCEKEALEIFMKKSYNDKGHKFQIEFTGIVHEKKSEFLKMNETASRNRCKELIETLAGNFEKALSEGLYTVPGGHQTFKEELKRIEEEYNKEPNKGIQGTQVLQEFLKSKEMIGATVLQSDNALTEKEKEMEAERAMAEARERERKHEEEKESQNKEKIKDDKRSLEENVKQLLEKVERERKLMQEQVERIIVDKERERKRYEDQGVRRNASMYQAQIDDLEVERKQYSEPAWYTPIIESIKSVASAFLPKTIVLAGEVANGVMTSFLNQKKEEMGKK